MPRETKSGKGSRSSKTARVLSLLTDPEAAAEEKSVAEEAAQKAVDASAQLAHDADTQAQIRDALESALNDEPQKPAPKSAPAPKPAAEAAVPQPEPAPAEPVPPEQPVSPEPEPEPVPAESAPQTEPAPEPAPAESVPQPEPAQAESHPEPDGEEHFNVLNVTQALVEEKTDKYIRMFGMCTCPRCRIDVIALALSNLPAKYVVVSDKDINPRLSIYESKYSAAVITQVMSACKKVLEKPHHKR